MTSRIGSHTGAEDIMNASMQVTVRQWFRLPKAERQRRILAFKTADAALQVNSEDEHKAGIREETELYHVMNGLVNDLWPTVPWWVRQ